MARPPALRVSPDRQVTASDIDCLKEAFALFDCDRDGEITVEELGKVSGASVISSSSYHPFQGFSPKLGFIYFFLKLAKKDPKYKEMRLLSLHQEVYLLKILPKARRTQALTALTTSTMHGM